MNINEMTPAGPAFLIPAGDYYLGDPACAFGNDQEWEDLEADNNFFEEDGIYPLRDGNEMLVFRLPSGPEYHSSYLPQGFENYSSLIALVPLPACTAPRYDLTESGTLHTFTEPAACFKSHSGMLMHFGKLTVEIETRSDL